MFHRSGKKLREPYDEVLSDTMPIYRSSASNWASKTFNLVYIKRKKGRDEP